MVLFVRKVAPFYLFGLTFYYLSCLLSLWFEPVVADLADGFHLRSAGCSCVCRCCGIYCGYVEKSRCRQCGCRCLNETIPEVWELGHPDFNKAYIWELGNTDWRRKINIWKFTNLNFTESEHHDPRVSCELLFMAVPGWRNPVSCVEVNYLNLRGPNVFPAALPPLWETIPAVHEIQWAACGLGAYQNRLLWSVF